MPNYQITERKCNLTPGRLKNIMPSLCLTTPQISDMWDLRLGVVIANSLSTSVQEGNSLNHISMVLGMYFLNVLADMC